MKKKNRFITLSILIVLLITFTIIYNCFIKQHNKPSSDTEGSKDYTAEDAIADGCFVIESDSTSSTHIQYGFSAPKVSGTEHWQRFLDNSSAKKKAFLRVAHFIGSDYCAFTDLYYSDGFYYLYNMDEYGIRKTGPCKYLRKLEGVDGIPKKDSYYYVLTDSLVLTFEDVRHSFISSNLSTITKIPFKWLGFTTYLD